MKGVILDRFGEPKDVLHVADAPMPVPGAGQVRVRMLAAPVNPSDLMTCRGTYTKIPSLPFAPGYEGVGVVESAGPGLFGKFLMGRRVAMLTGDGGSWQEYNVIPARQAVPLSQQIPIDQAAMFFVNPTTAYVLTREVLKVPRGAWLLQTASGSALGKMVIRLAGHYGFRTICVVRRSVQAQELIKLGADEVVATDEQDLHERVKQITGGKGVLYAIDPVSGDLGSRVIRCLAPDGRLVVFGTLSHQPLQFSSRDLMTPGASVEGFWLGNFMAKLGLLKKLSIVSKVGSLMKKGILVSEIGKTYRLDEIKEACIEAERTARGGKVLLRISQG